MTRADLLHHHATLAMYGNDIGTRGPMVRWQDQGVPRWWVLPIMCACFAFVWAVVR